MINDLTGVEKAKNVVIQFQISLSKTNIEQSIVVFDYTQMDRSLKEERTPLIKSCFDAKGSATGREMEDLLELEEQLLKMRFQSLNRFITEKESSISLFDTNDKSFSATATSHPSAANEKCVGSRKFLVTAWREYVLRQESIHCSIVHDEYMGNQLFRLISYKRFCKAALAAQIAAGPLFAPIDMSAFESKYKDPSSIKWTVNITSEKFVELMLMRIPTNESIVNTRLILKNYPTASVADQDILDIRFKLWKDMGDIRFLILAIGNAVAFKKTFSLLMLFG
nr:putative E3 ubiquitin-protein ligase RF298 isoform X2 [Ipomoea trifida]